MMGPLDEVMIEEIIHDVPKPTMQPVVPSAILPAEQPAVRPVHADTAQPLPSSDDTFIDYLLQVTVTFYTYHFDLLDKKGKLKY